MCFYYYHFFGEIKMYIYFIYYFQVFFDINGDAIRYD